jgi:hypothetical protein
MAWNRNTLIENTGRELEEIIERHHSFLLRVAAFELIGLFWNIGNELNNFILQQKEDPGNHTLSIAGRYLQKHFGGYFAEDNLTMMKEFSKALPYFLEGSHREAIVLEHIPTLLQLSTDQERSFYLTKLLEYGLTGKELHNFVDGQSIEQIIEKRVSAKQSRPRDVADFISNLFEEPDRLLFCPLFVARTTGNHLSSDTSLTDINAALLKTLTDQIISFRDKLSKRINYDINRFCMEIGICLHQLSDMQPDSKNWEKMAGQLGNSIKSRFGKNIDAEQLRDMFLFVDRIPDRPIATRIGKLITWQHIRVLLPLNTVEEWLYYARIAAAQGLDSESLKSKIDQYEFAKNPAAKILEEELISKLLNPQVETQVEVTGNAISQATIYHTSFGDDVKMSRAIGNIFENPLIDFLTRF